MARMKDGLLRVIVVVSYRWCGESNGRLYVVRGSHIDFGGTVCSVSPEFVTANCKEGGALVCEA